MTFLVTDKIRVFVSSRLEECIDERLSAKTAIESLNHQPVMFEAAGARPYPPRSVYLKGVEESDIFIGIYKEGYGFIAEDMSISGLEDEYNYSKARGIPQLLYVRKGVDRDSRLSDLIAKFTGPDLTISYFTSTDNLAERIRDDLAATIADYFRRGHGLATLHLPNPADIVNELVPADKRVRRTELEKELRDRLDSNERVHVSGPLGSGKTVLLAAMAAENGWVFVECGIRSPKEILSDVANGLRARIELPPKAFLSIAEVGSALQAAWQASGPATIVLDDVRVQDQIDGLLTLQSQIDGARVIASSRNAIELAGAELPIPRLDNAEIANFISINRDSAPVSGELEELAQASNGNPLYLRYYLLGEPRKFESSLKDYEVKVWKSLSSSAREALSYMALSSRPLALTELAELLTGESGRIEQVAESLESARSVVAESSRGYAIFHPHAKSTVQKQIQSSAAKNEFYANRLSNWFIKSRDYTAAFDALDIAGIEKPESLLERAVRHASVYGNAVTAISAIGELIERSRQTHDHDRERDLLLYLAQAQAQAGLIQAALESIDRAAALHTESEPPVDPEELRASVNAVTRGDISAANFLRDRKADFLQVDDAWNAARIAVDLSVYLVRQKEYEAAAEEARFAITIFDECEDEYGLSIAKLNLMSALSGIPSEAAEANRMLQELQESAEESPRQRALVCNVLGRRSREQGDFLAAKEYAKEAIEIGRETGDANTVCNNLINLGNAYREERDLDSAIVQYEAADKRASEAGLVLIEASAQELLASVFNRKDEASRAVHHANYAISISKDGVAPQTESDALEELAIAFELSDERENAWRAWLKHAKKEVAIEGNQGAGTYGLCRAARLLCETNDMSSYRDAYHELLQGNFTNRDKFSVGECLVYDLNPIVDEASEDLLFDLTSYHVRLVIDRVPTLFARRCFLEMISRLFGDGYTSENASKRQRAALAIAMTIPIDDLNLADMASIGRAFARVDDGVSFRAQSDGAAHWAIKADLGCEAIVTISQLDDRSDVALVALCVSLVLKTFGKELFEEIAGGVPPERNEL